MWKFLLGGIAVTVSTAIGRAAVGKFGRRYSFFSEMKRLNGELIRNLSFRMLPVTEILSDARQRYPSVKDTLDALLFSTENDCVFVFRNADLNEEERSFAEEYFRRAGGGNRESEKGFLEEYAEYFARKEKECAAEKKRYSALGGKLGFLAGVAVMILIL